MRLVGFYDPSHWKSEGGVNMRNNKWDYQSIALIVGSVALIGLSAIPGLAQTDPLYQGKPVAVKRVRKGNRKIHKKTPPLVQLLKLEWRVYKVKDDGSQEETSP